MDIGKEVTCLGTVGLESRIYWKKKVKREREKRKMERN
jgi:hypothetical protein